MRALSVDEGRNSAMTIGRGHRELPVRPGFAWEWLRFVAPAWYVRMRLRRTDREIVRLERLLADEFALLETAPLLQEHALLVAHRDALLHDLGR